ncbi:MAG: hypothetical protein ABSF64_27585 [Bryobacteraceae bacterium]
MLCRFRGLAGGASPMDDRVVLGGQFSLCPTGCGVVFKVAQ